VTFAQLILHPPHGDRSVQTLKDWLGFGFDA